MTIKLGKSLDVVLHNLIKAEHEDRLWWSKYRGIEWETRNSSLSVMYSSCMHSLCDSLRRTLNERLQTR